MQAEVSQAAGPGAIAVRPCEGLFVKLTMEVTCDIVAAEASDGAGGICGDGRAWRTLYAFREQRKQWGTASGLAVFLFADPSMARISAGPRCPWLIITAKNSESSQPRQCGDVMPGAVLLLANELSKHQAWRDDRATSSFRWHSGAKVRVCEPVGSARRRRRAASIAVHGWSGRGRDNHWSLPASINAVSTVFRSRAGSVAMTTSPPLNNPAGSVASGNGLSQGEC